MFKEHIKEALKSDDKTRRVLGALGVHDIARLALPDDKLPTSNSYADTVVIAAGENLLPDFELDELLITCATLRQKQQEDAEARAAAEAYDIERAAQYDPAVVYNGQCLVRV